MQGPGRLLRLPLPGHGCLCPPSAVDGPTGCGPSGRAARESSRDGQPPFATRPLPPPSLAARPGLGSRHVELSAAVQRYFGPPAEVPPSPPGQPAIQPRPCAEGLVPVPDRWRTVATSKKAPTEKEKKEERRGRWRPKEEETAACVRVCGVPVVCLRCACGVPAVFACGLCLSLHRPDIASRPIPAACMPCTHALPPGLAEATAGARARRPEQAYVCNELILQPPSHSLSDT
ncbi:hypothetical protein CDD83_8766 [Cordyceps sp. RAO-2017]|nr:hypothetical protein CDD83_8766 [Cordyceps sp. RAO-2017]